MTWHDGFSRLLRRVRRGWQRNGLFGFLHLVLRNLSYGIRSAVKGGVPERRVDGFDRRHGTDTGGIREAGSLDVASRNSLHANRYQATDDDLLEAIFSDMKIDFSRYTFIDFGSGKGRVLLKASFYPFRKIVGLEFSSELHETALDNVRIFSDPNQQCHRIQPECRDATEYDLPETPLVCYFYNPFDATVMEKVVGRLAEHRKSNGVPVIVIYVDPVHRSVFERTGIFKLARDHPQFIQLMA